MTAVSDSRRKTPKRETAGCAPLRRPGSVRRTSSINVAWPEGRNGPTLLVGRARDIVTPASGGAPAVIAEDSFTTKLARDRTILDIAASPPRPALARLVDQRGGGKLRKALQDVVPEERAGATPLYLLLDDISGASLVSGWAFSQWDPNWLETLKKAAEDPALAKAFPDRTGICAGFAPGSSGFNFTADRTGTPVPELQHPDDPDGWHHMDKQTEMGMRRARRIDVWREDGVIRIDAAFQDSASRPDGGRAAVHEYTLSATADPQTMRLLSVEPQPRVLPFVECETAVLTASRLVGAPLPDLRERVLEELKGTAGCTHLNDALRALAEVPALVGHLAGQTGMP